MKINYIFLLVNLLFNLYILPSLNIELRNLENNLIGLSKYVKNINKVPEKPIEPREPFGSTFINQKLKYIFKPEVIKKNNIPGDYQALINYDKDKNIYQLRVLQEEKEIGCNYNWLINAIFLLEICSNPADKFYENYAKLFNKNLYDNLKKSWDIKPDLEEKNCEDIYTKIVNNIKPEALKGKIILNINDKEKIQDQLKIKINAFAIRLITKNNHAICVIINKQDKNIEYLICDSLNQDYKLNPDFLNLINSFKIIK